MTRIAKKRLRWLLTLLVVVILAVYLFPIYWMISASFQENLTTANAEWFPTSPGFGGYIAAFQSGGFDGLRVSLVVSIGTVILTLLIATPAAFALSRLRSRAVSVGLTLLLLAQMIPSVVLSLSFYAMFNSWGILNSYLGLILANATASIPFATILMRSMMRSLDTEVIEAGTIDGLGPVGNFLRIVGPLSRNAIITAAVFSFLFSWGDLLFGVTLVTKTEMYPVTVLIYALTNSNLTQWSTVMAMSLVASIPALIIIFAAQRYVKAGLASGTGR